MLKTERLVHAALCAAVALMLANSAAYAQTDTPVREHIYRAAIDADGVQRVKILAGSYFFKPDHIVVKANTRVELSVSLEPGIVPHTLVIQAVEAGIAIDESLGTEPKTFAFTPKAAGKFPFYCRNKLLFFKSHREKGMEGTLEVVE